MPHLFPSQLSSTNHLSLNTLVKMTKEEAMRYHDRPFLKFSLMYLKGETVEQDNHLFALLNHITAHEIKG